MRKKQLYIKISAIITALALVIGGVVIYLSFADSILVQRATRNFREEITTRIDNTILSKFAPLWNTLSNGVICVGLSTSQDMGNISLYRNRANREIAFISEINRDGVESNLSIFANTDMFSVQSSLLSRENYNVDISNIVDEFAPLGHDLGMSQEDILAFAQWAEVVSTAPVNWSRLSRPYVRTAVRHFRRNESSVNVMMSNQRGDSARRISYNFDKTAITQLLTDIHTRMAGDDDLRPLFGVFGADAYNNALYWINHIAESMDDEHEASIVLLVGNGNRLLNFQIIFGDYSIEINTGNSAMDTWVISVATPSLSLEIHWNIAQEENTNTNYFTINFNNVTLNLSMTKDKDSGEFSFNIGVLNWYLSLLEGRVTAYEDEFNFEARAGDISVTISAVVGGTLVTDE